MRVAWLFGEVTRILLRPPDSSVEVEARTYEKMKKRVIKNAHAEPKFEKLQVACLQESPDSAGGQMRGAIKCHQKEAGANRGIKIFPNM